MVSIVLINFGWCKLEVVSIITTTEGSLAKVSKNCCSTALGSLTPTRINFFLVVFQMAANSDKFSSIVNSFKVEEMIFGATDNSVVVSYNGSSNGALMCTGPLLAKAV